MGTGLDFWRIFIKLSHVAFLCEFPALFRETPGLVQPVCSLGFGAFFFIRASRHSKNKKIPLIYIFI